MKFHCMFEQSGTFKNEFKKLGYYAVDYDIQNKFNETDFVIDLYKEIENAYDNKPSVFDNIKQEDYIIAFFPCIRFEDQIQLHFRGDAFQMKKWTDIQKLEKDIELHNDLHYLYIIITKLTIVCIKRKLKLIIENPLGTYHYLNKYWSIRPKLIDKNRRLRGDYYKKPTQYWFINCEPKNNIILDKNENKYQKISINDVNNKIKRSLISAEYANRFIREFILF